MTQGEVRIVESAPLTPAAREALTQIVVSDDALRLRLARVVNRALDVAEEMLNTAPPPTQLAIARALIPATIRELREEKQDESLEELKTQLMALHADIRRQIDEKAIDVQSWEEDALVVDEPPTAPEAP